MPTYEYKCDACGNQFERFQAITAAPIRKCPSCGKNKVRRLISAGAGLIFKGSGFYITDYRSEGYKNAAKQGEGGAAPAGEGKTGAKADSKPAATTAPSDSKPAPKSDAKKKKS